MYAMSCPDLDVYGFQELLKEAEEAEKELKGKKPESGIWSLSMGCSI